MAKQAMKDMVKGLVAKKEKLEKDLEKVDDAIEALQKVCEHDMVYDGHDSHYNYEKCTICGFLDDRC